MDTVQELVNSEGYTSSSEPLRTKGSSSTVLKATNSIYSMCLATEENFDMLAVVWCHLKEYFFKFTYYNQENTPNLLYKHQQGTNV
jgi:hypothetical protein